MLVTIPPYYFRAATISPITILSKVAPIIAISIIIYKIDTKKTTNKYFV